MKNTLLPMLLVGVAITVVGIILKWVWPQRRLRNTRNCESIPLHCSPEVFCERFQRDIVPAPNGNGAFEGLAFRDGHFFFTYSPLGIGKGCTSIAGIAEENVVYYKLSGVSSRPDFELERLINKLRELCAPEPEATPLPEAE